MSKTDRPPLSKIRILQLGNVCVSASDREILESVHPFEHAVTNFLRGSNRLDYIVICGNITSDGSEESFQLAHERIKTVVERRLINDQAAADRLVVVPGPNDIADDPGAPDFTNFAKFHRHLFEDIFGKEPPLYFDSKECIDYRQLKDMTLIGVPYWNVPSDPHLDDPQLQLAEILEQRLRAVEAEALEYGKATPTILISAETPLLAHPEHDYLACDDKLQAIFDKKLRIWLHLFGQGSMTHLPSEPFRYPHYSLGVDTVSKHAPDGQKKSALWPLRMNLIRIELPLHRCHDNHTVTDPIRDRKTRVLTRVEHLRHRDPDEVKEGYLESSMVRHFYLRARDVAYKNDEKLLGTLLKDVYRDLFKGKPPAQALSIQVLPGCGLRLTHRKLAEYFRHLREPIRVHAVEMPEDGETTWDQAWRDLGEFMEKNRGSLSPDNPLLVLMYDPSFALTDGEFMRDRLECMRRMMDQDEFGYEFGDQSLKLIHLTYHQDDLPMSGAGFRPVELSKPNDGGVDELHERFARRLPMDRRQLRSYTGSTLGFTRLVLEAASEEFEKDWPGGRRVSNQSPRELVEHAVERKESLNDVGENFLQWMRLRDSSVGETMFMYLRQNLLRKNAGNNTVDFTEFFADPEIKKNKTKAFRLIAELCRRQFMHWEDEDKKLICVDVIAPFLCEIVYEIFLSYGLPLETTAEVVKETIEFEARLLGQDVLVHSYLSKDWHPDGATTDEAVARRLRDSSAIVFLHNQGDEIREGVREEIEIWQDLGGHDTRTAVLLLPNRHARPEDVPELQRLHAFYYENEDYKKGILRVNDVCRELLRYFSHNVYDGNLRWILRPQRNENETVVVSQD